jgi:multicomponent Na+:H+ antiporter subunit D
MSVQSVIILGPIVFPIVFAVLGIFLARNRTLQHGIGLLGSLLAWVCSLLVLALNIQGNTVVYMLGGWQPPYGIVLVADMMASIFAVMGTTIFVSGTIYVLGCKDKCITYPVFMPLFLCMGAGLSGVFYTGDIFTLFVFIELMVISSVILVAISDSKLGLEAAIKYLFISALGTLFLLTGIAALYATYGTLNIADIGRLLSSGQRPLLAQTAALMLMCAFLLKSAVFPFHFWQPDFHTTAPTPVSAMLSSVIVKAGVYGLIRMLTLLFVAEAQLVDSVLIVLGLIGVFFGGLSALRTYDAKRLLAYSTLAQVGFILVCIGLNTSLGLAAALVYAVNHAFIKSSLLMSTGALASRLVPKSASLVDLGGAGKSMALISGLYLLGGLALAGVPPLNGFISKLGMVMSTIDSARWFVTALVVGSGVITLFYMVRTWQWIFQQPTQEGVKTKKMGDSLLAPAFLIAACVALGLFAGPLLDLAARAATQLGNPQEYIRAVLGG